MKDRMTWKNLLVVLTIMSAVSVGSTARAEWQFGIGTGLMAMKAEGDMGLHLTAPALDIPVEFAMELDPDDFQDLMESAIGFGGFATDGKWMIQYSYSNLVLQGDDTVVLPGGLTTVTFFTEFDMTGAEVVVGYPFYQGDSFTLRLLGGVRYTGHELTGVVTATGAVNDQRSRKIDEDWTDVVIGVMADVKLAEKWNWSTRIDGGFGGSEGTYFVNTGLNWRFHRNWGATLYGRYMAVDFENDSKGDEDWYLYDVDESGVGLTIMFIW